MMDDGTHHHSKEADFGWSKPSLHWDLDHCLHTIIEGLDDHLKWFDKDQWWEFFRVVLGLVTSRS
jgi:hypothetical protein